MRLFRRKRWMRLAARCATLAIGATLGALSVSALGTAAQAEMRQPPNSRVAIDVDSRFQPTDRYTGFADEKSGVSFVIVEMPSQAFNELKHIGDAPEALTAKGVTDAVKKDLAGREGDYVYITAKQKTGDTDVAKFILIFKENRATVMLTANVPQKAIDDGSFTTAQIEQTLAGAKVMDQVVEQSTLFKLNYLGPFKDSFGLAGTSKAYTPSGKTPSAGENRAIVEPILIVTPSTDNRPIPDVKAAAQRSFNTFGGLTEKTVRSEKDITIAGLKGYQITGEVTEPTSGEKLALQLVLLLGAEGGYYAMAATCPLGDAAKFMPEIDKVMASFEPAKAK
jgi:hypothetical protein